MIGLISLVTLAIGVLCGSVGTIFLKKGSQNLKLSILFKNVPFLFGNFLFFLSVVFYSIALKKEELSVVYPLTSIGYLIVVLLSVKYLNEKMNPLKWVGIIFIILGVFLIIN
jgi:multidrug transporter EmrE-like cation transporter